MDLPEIPILSPLYLSCLLLRMSPRVHTRLIILYSLSLLNYSFDCSPSSSRRKGALSPSVMAHGVTFIVCGGGWAWVGGNCGKGVLYPGPQVHLVLLWSDLWSNKVMSCWMWTWHHMSLMRLFLLCCYWDWCPGQLVVVGVTKGCVFHLERNEICGTFPVAEEEERLAGVKWHRHMWKKEEQQQPADSTI